MDQRRPKIPDRAYAIKGVISDTLACLVADTAIASMDMEAVGGKQ